MAVNRFSADQLLSDRVLSDRRRFDRSLLFWCLLLGVLSGGPSPTNAPLDFLVILRSPQAIAAEVDFNREVRPLLSTTCYPCHGPDDEAREADLRLDLPDDAYDTGALVPGDPKESRVIERIFSTDDDVRMPPLDAKHQLTDVQRRLLRRWVVEGARYAKHWSLVAPRRPAIPTGVWESWQRNPIDAFVARKLQNNGLKPSPPADRYTLVRRLHLDLTGLPPTPEQADSFVRDSRPDAYERLVNQLLDSPHYGERWARRWLDLARFSDTNGYEKDRPRTMWPYRDWLIQAFNDDLPFDQFTIEQVAGDMLPDATLSQRIATGFHRNTMINEEGGIDPEEFRYLAIVDRLATTGATWLGLTIGCAQCHSHKYDPISQTDYFRLFAMMNNANEDVVVVPTDDIVAQRQALQNQIDTLTNQLADVFPLLAEGQSETLDRSEQDASDVSELRKRRLQTCFSEWQATAVTQAIDWTVLVPQQVDSSLASVDILDDGSVLVSGDTTKNDTFTLHLLPQGQQITALRLETLPHPSLPQNGPGRRVAGQGASAGTGDFFLSSLTASWIDGERNAHDIPLTNATESYGAKKRPAAHAIDGKSDTGWSVAGRPGERHVAVFQLETPLIVTPQIGLQVRLEHESFYPSGLGHFRVSLTDDTRDVKASSLPEEIEIALLTRLEQRSADQQRRLLNYYLSIAPELAEQHKQIEALRKQQPALPETFVLQERPLRHKRLTHRHHRGEFLSPREMVTPGTPESLHPLPVGTDPNRLALARWLVDRRNPLTARVFVNRQWEALFGKGLVRTSEDFGVQGELSSHPDLLDWLAMEFMDQGWSIKYLHRLIVMSATYRQSSSVTPELASRDPQNRLLARGSRFRLDAELVRDTVLSASGQLSRKIGGPSVFPVQPPGITEGSYGPLTWTVSEGEDRYRRGLYTFSKRTAPYVAFQLFDAPSGEACVARRVNTNTPLQALNLLNDPVVIEAARALAHQAMLSSRIQEKKVENEEAVIAEAIWRRCVTRPPQRAELADVLKYYHQQCERFRGDPSCTLTIIGSDQPADQSTKQEEFAAWTLVARALLNLDETITRP